MPRLFPEVVITPEILDPECFDSGDVHRQVLLNLQHAFRSARFARWSGTREQSEMILAKAANCPASKEFWKWMCKNKRVLCDAVPGDDSFEVARNLHGCRTVDGVLLDCISEAPDGFPIPCEKAVAVRDGIPDWWGETSPSHLIKAEELAHVLSPLLRYSTEIHLVNRYFTPEREAMNPFLIRTVREIHGGKRITRLYLHTSSKITALGDLTSVSDEEVVDRLLNGCPVLREVRKLSFCVWNDNRLPDGMLERYILTNIGGCNVTHLFDSEPHRVHDIFVLTNTVLKHLLQRYETSREQLFPNALLRRIDLSSGTL